MQNRKITLLIAAAALLAMAVAAAAFGGPASGSAAAASAPHRATGAAKVSVASTPLGRILVDGRGRTLYLFEQDKGRVSSCYSGCASVWPPFTIKGKPAAGRGVLARRLGTTKRKDGKLEVTYNGHPLYYYAGDAKRGDVNGQGADGSWFVLAPSGKKIERS
jgi:predicted lipoprotein with Yx(FWY)xxD motif